MSLASKIGTAIGTGTAYVVHYMGKTATPLGVVGTIYANRSKIQQFAVKHSLDRSSPDAIQNNLLKCLEYID